LQFMCEIRWGVTDSESRHPDDLTLYGCGAGSSCCSTPLWNANQCWDVGSVPSDEV